MEIRWRTLFIALIICVLVSPLIYISYIFTLAYTPSFPRDNVETIFIGSEDGTTRNIDPSTPEGRRLLSQCRNALCHVDAACMGLITGNNVKEQVELNSTYVKIVYSESQEVSFFGLASLVMYKRNTTEVLFFLSGELRSHLLILNGYYDKWQDTIWGMYGIKDINRWIPI